MFQLQYNKPVNHNKTDKIKVESYTGNKRKQRSLTHHKKKIFNIKKKSLPYRLYIYPQYLCLIVCLQCNTCSLLLKFSYSGQQVNGYIKAHLLVTQPKLFPLSLISVIITELEIFCKTATYSLGINTGR